MLLKGRLIFDNINNKYQAKQFFIKKAKANNWSEDEIYRILNEIGDIDSIDNDVYIYAISEYFY